MPKPRAYKSPSTPYHKKTMQKMKMTKMSAKPPKKADPNPARSGYRNANKQLEYLEKEGY